MYAKVLSVLALAGVVRSHMSIFYPPPLGGAPSINKQSTDLDPEFNYPLGCCGSSGGPTRPSPGLCRGHLDKFDTEDATVTWEAGQDAYFQLTDYSYDPNAPGGTHSGGSCQVGFSVDKGVTWKVAASYHGACPHETEDGSPEAQTFDFKVPLDMPEGDAIFAWIWLNREHEAFMNCSKVKISAGSGSTPSQPAQSSTASKQPVPSAITPTYPQESTTEPDDNEEPAPPVTSSRAGNRPRPTNPTVTTTVIRTITAGAEPTEAPTSDDSEDSEKSEDPHVDDSEDTEESDDDNEDNEDNDWWSSRPHRKVVEGSRRYQVDNSSCVCRRDTTTLAARCSCDGPASKRTVTERKALRMHRRTFYKRVDACSWATAPAMEVSYYTEDAKCAPNAKLNTPESDDFEIKWDVSCGVVEGASDYTLKTMQCGMYGA